MSRSHDLGSGYELHEYHDEHRDPTLVGYTITGPAAPQCKSPYAGRCGGLAATCPYSVPLGEKATRTFSVWQVSGEWPNITLSPSVACDCGGQHGYIRDGKYVNAGGVVA